MSFRICVIGCGEHSRAAHGPSLRRYAAAHSDVVLDACCDRDASRAESWRAEFGFRRTLPDVSSVLGEAPDALILAVTPSAASGVAEEVFRRGVPVLLEKPPALDVRGVRRLARRSGGVPHLVAFNRRFFPLMVELYNALHGPASPGPIQVISYSMIRVDRRDPDFSTTAIHAFDAVRFLAASDYAELRFSYRDVPGMGPGVTDVVAEGRMRSGTRVLLSICPASGAVIERAEVHVTGHSYFLHLPVWNALDAPGRLIHLHDGKLMEERRGESGTGKADLVDTNGFLAELTTFLDGVRSGRALSPDLASSVQSVQVMQAMRKRRPVYRSPRAGLG